MEGQKARPIDRKGPIRTLERIATYSVVFIVLLFIFIFVRGAEWRSNESLHTFFELTAVIVSSVVGVLSLIHFYTKRENIFLIVGLGFLGTALLDGYHIIVAFEFLNYLFPSSPSSLIVWSWNVSRIFLAAMMFLSLWAAIREDRRGELGKIHLRQAAFLVGALTVLSFLFFAFSPLPPAYYKVLYFSSPQEFIAGFFFIAALVGYFKRGLWRQEYFDHWIILSLIIGGAVQVMYMVFSRQLFDPLFDIAHVLKIVSYVVMLIGLLISIYHLVSDAQGSKKKLIAQNVELLKMQRELEIKKMEFTGQVKDMARQNERLEETQKIAFKLVKDVGKAKAEIEQEQAKDEALLSSIGEGIIATDRVGKIIKVNSFAMELLGLSGRSKLEGKSVFTVVPLQDEAGKDILLKQHPINRALSQGKKVVTLDYYIVRKDGSRFPVAATITPIDFGKVVIGTITVFRDITLEKEVNRAKTEFVSLASHQLRTPLSAITWYGEMLLDEEVGKINDKQRQYLEALYASTQRMVELVQAFLNVSRIELGTFAIEPEPTDLGKIVENVIGELQKHIQDKSLKIAKNYDPHLPLLNLAPNLMTIIFQNLISNAVKYTAEGGTIGLDIKCQKSDILVSVSDTGYGIPKHEQGKIFGKLFRADNVREKVPDGNGLGLYIVKAIVEQSGGKIWFESEENKGTTFYITLPLSGMKRKKGSRALSI